MSAQDAEVETWTSDDEDSSDDVVLGTPAAPAADAATDSPAEDEPEVVETAAVPSPVAAAPPAVPAMAAVPAVTTTPGGGDLDEDTKADSGAPAPVPSAAPAKPAMASGSGGASGPGASGTCPVVCGPGVQRRTLAVCASFCGMPVSRVRSFLRSLWLHVALTPPPRLVLWECFLCDPQCCGG